MIQQKRKKNKSLGNSDDRAHQIAGQNDDNTLGIFRANLELKHYVHQMFMLQGRGEQQRVCKLFKFCKF